MLANVVFLNQYEYEMCIKRIHVYNIEHIHDKFGKSAANE